MKYLLVLLLISCASQPKEAPPCNNMPYYRVIVKSTTKATCDSEVIIIEQKGTDLDCDGVLSESETSEYNKRCSEKK